MLGTRNVKNKFIPSKDNMFFLPSGVTILLWRWTKYKNAPKRPNKLPEDPADIDSKLKKYVARFPPRPVSRKNNKYFLAPISLSIWGPNIYKAYPLKNKCIAPICMKIEVISR